MRRVQRVIRNPIEEGRTAPHRAGNLFKRTPGGALRRIESPGITLEESRGRHTHSRSPGILMRSSRDAHRRRHGPGRGSGA